MNRSYLRHVYGEPAFLAGITVAGLLSAIFGNGAWDLLSWIALAIPLLVLAWKWCRPIRRS
jgi:hypothetical protein